MDQLFYLNNYVGILSAVVESNDEIPADTEQPGTPENEPAVPTGDPARAGVYLVMLPGAAVMVAVLRKKRKVQ